MDEPPEHEIVNGVPAGDVVEYDEEQTGATYPAPGTGSLFFRPDSLNVYAPTTAPYATLFASGVTTNAAWVTVSAAVALVVNE
ncbi:unannotated protein [freshwater metagenome]|uniref:Unannotated protein n=1 Tax=freshwater metagenome TaxID=449393 RepID=A0A6J7ECZ1_9ZZZZ